MRLRISLPCVSKLWLWSKHGHRNLKHWELPVISHFLSIFYIQLASSLDFLSDLAFTHLPLAGFVAWGASRFLILSSNHCPGLLIGLLQAVSASAELFCNQMPLRHTTSFSLTTGAGPPPHFLNVTFMLNFQVQSLLSPIASFRAVFPSSFSTCFRWQTCSRTHVQFIVHCQQSELSAPGWLPAPLGTLQFAFTCGAGEPTKNAPLFPQSVWAWATPVIKPHSLSSLTCDLKCLTGRETPDL